MQLNVLFFGVVRDITGLGTEQTALPEGATVADLFAAYAARFPRLQEYSGSLVLAVDQQFCPRSTVLRDGAEVAFLPPVSGGTAAAGQAPYTHVIDDPQGHFFALTREPIDSRAIVARLQRGEDGAVVTFEGVVRNNSKGRKTRFLDYECYEAMAIAMLARIGREIAARHEIDRIALVHRLGRMQIGEASVAVVVTSAHRRPAFDAALEGINRLKKLVPIWKKEYFEDGEVWVEGDWDPDVLQQSQPSEPAQ